MTLRWLKLHRELGLHQKRWAISSLRCVGTAEFLMEFRNWQGCRDRPLEFVRFLHKLVLPRRSRTVLPPGETVLGVYVL